MIEGCSLALAYEHTTGASCNPAGSSASTIAQADLAALVATYSSLLFRVAHSVLRNRAEAEDVVQDVFLRVLQHLRKSHSKPGFESIRQSIRDPRVWLVRIAWNLALDRRRLIRPDQMDGLFAASLLGPGAPADQALDEAQRIAAVLRELDRLPQAERQVLLLCALEELSTSEIAAITARSESAVRALLFRARTRLRERLHSKSLPPRPAKGARP